VSSTLVVDGSDITRLVVRITDEYGNPLLYVIRVVSLEIAGEAHLIGENPFSMVGGQGALYVRARHRPGTATVTATIAGLPAVSTTVTLLPPGS
jgi:beta-galactosidase